MRKYRIHVLFGFGLIVLVLVGVVTYAYRTHSIPNGALRVVFLDVGQGDAIFIESPTGTQILIDGGKNTSVLRELGRVMGFFDRSLDMIIATHPDADHIGGLIDVFERYDVSTVLRTENIQDTPYAKSFDERVDKENATVHIARSGQVYEIGTGERGSTTLTILFPDRDPTNMESNTASIIIQLAYGDTRYLFTGDAPDEIERYMVALYGNFLRSDVLKIGHHGSRTSSDAQFIQTVSPHYGIISAGKDNTYGHPHKEVVDTLNSYNVQIRSTAEEGRIRTYSDGITVRVLR